MKKRYIASASRKTGSRSVFASTDPSDIHPALEDISINAYHAGYDLIAKGDSLENVSLELIAMENTEIMPKITIWLDTSSYASEGVIYPECKVKFPDINTSNLEFADSAEYIVDKFKNVARFVTYLMKNSIVPADWEDDDYEE